MTYTIGVILIFVLAGLMPVLLGIKGLMDKLKLSKKGIRLKGVVTGLAESGAYMRKLRKHLITYAPLVQFQFENQSYQFVDHLYTPKPQYEKGTEVEVLVNPDFPNDAGLVASRFKGIAKNFGILFFGVLVLLVCFVFYKKHLFYAYWVSAAIIAFVAVLYLKSSRDNKDYDPKKPLTLEEVAQIEKATLYSAEDYFKLHTYG